MLHTQLLQGHVFSRGAILHSPDVQTHIHADHTVAPKLPSCDAFFFLNAVAEAAVP